MEQIKLEVQVRERVGSRKIRSLRRENFVPGVVYGGKEKPTAIKVDRKNYERIMRLHHGQNVIFQLNLMNGGKKLKDYSALVKEEQHDPVWDNLLHIDFHRISLTEVIEVKVAIAVKGEAIGVKRDHGSLEQHIWELDVMCLPTEIPQKIEVDVKDLGIGDSVHVKDLILPPGVKTKHDPEGLVLSVVHSMREEAAVVTPSEAPEVVVTKEKEKVAAPGAGADAKADAKAKPEAAKPAAAPEKEKK